MGVNLLGKIKIHEIAKELGLTSKQIIEKANSLGIDVSSHMSSVDEEQAKRIKDSLSGKSNGAAKTLKNDKTEKKSGKDEKSVKAGKTEKNKKAKD